jgi:coproporphyrinogen III oxidase-like Fe-S oxidoreductase
MLRREDEATPAVRFANGDELEGYIAGESELAQVTPRPEMISRQMADEERIFLGMRLNAGMQLEEQVEAEILAELVEDGLLEGEAAVRLTARGRLLSNEVFERLIGAMKG